MKSHKVNVKKEKNELIYWKILIKTLKLKNKQLIIIQYTYQQFTTFMRIGEYNSSVS